MDRGREHSMCVCACMCVNDLGFLHIRTVQLLHYLPSSKNREWTLLIHTASACDIKWKIAFTLSSSLLYLHSKCFKWFFLCQRMYMWDNTGEDFILFEV